MHSGATPQARPMMTIQESVKTCIRKYADFSGRATRAEYWWWVLATVLVGIAVGTIDSFISLLAGSYGYSPLSTIFALVVLLPDLAVTCRRLHDIGKSGWWQLVWVVLAVLAVVPIVVGVVIALSGLFAGEGSWGEWWSAISWAPIVVGVVIAFLVWIVLLVWWLVWMVKQGQAGPNHYGPDPRIWDGEGAVQ